MSLISVEAFEIYLSYFEVSQESLKLDFRGPAAVLVVRHEHERWVDIVANAGDCFVVAPRSPRTTPMTPNISTHQIYKHVVAFIVLLKYA